MQVEYMRSNRESLLRGSYSCDKPSSHAGLHEFVSRIAMAKSAEFESHATG